MTRIHGLGIVVAASIALAIGGQLHTFKMPISASAPAAVPEPSAEELRKSAAFSFTNAASRHLRNVYISRWSKVLVSENAKTVCLEYEIGNNPKRPEHGVAMLVDGRASEVEPDWAQNCSSWLYDLTAEISAANQQNVTNR